MKPLMIQEKLYGAVLHEGHQDINYQTERSNYPEHAGWHQNPLYHISFTFRRLRDGDGYMATNMFNIIQELYKDLSRNETLEIHII